MRLVPDDLKCAPPAHMLWVRRHYDQGIEESFQWTPIVEWMSYNLSNRIHTTYCKIVWKGGEWRVVLEFASDDGGGFIEFHEAELPLSAIWVVPYVFKRVAYTVNGVEYKDLFVDEQRWNQLASMGFIPRLDKENALIYIRWHDKKILTGPDDLRDRRHPYIR